MPQASGSLVSSGYDAVADSVYVMGVERDALLAGPQGALGGPRGRRSSGAGGGHAATGPLRTRSAGSSTSGRRTQPRATIDGSCHRQRCCDSLNNCCLRSSAAGRVRTLRLGPRDLDLPNYSERVLRGALVNAFAHRHYTMPGDTVIRQTAAYLEIENPGAWGVSKPRLALGSVSVRSPLSVEIGASSGRMAVTRRCLSAGRWSRGYPSRPDQLRGPTERARDPVG
jgi:hypothetical protein